MPRKVALIFGTRPEAIKLAPVYLELRRRSEEFTPLLWLTGQHRQMLDQVMATFKLTGDRDLNLMKPGQSLVDVTSGVLEGMTRVFAEERPDCILVQGDTTTVFAAGLAAFYQRIPVGHVEAGLRTFNKWSPFPEEMNRQLTTRLTDFHFAPTTQSRDNLVAEGVAAGQVWVTGNTVIDALDIVAKHVRAARPEMPADFPLAALEGARRMVLITGHRRENFGAGFEQLCQAIVDLALAFPETEFIYPVHLNPNVREPVFRILQGRQNLHLIEPLSYEPFVWAMDRAHFLLSDSGGVQEEAPHLGKPVLVMRDTTERPEAIAAGTSKLVGTDRDVIVREATRLLQDETAYRAMSQARNPFGDGHASEKIADALARELK
jgi:UDP-N-acetylglucosamine 2-epimerase (non-hydrolysing)